MKGKRIGFLVTSLVLVTIFSLFLGCRRGTAVQNEQSYRPSSKRGAVQQPAVQPAVVLDFKGEWVISNWEERGTLTMKHDVKIVTITEQNGIYYIEGPDWFFNDAKFRLSRNSLVGNYVATYEDLTDMFSTFPDEVLKSAANNRNVIYSGSLVMLRDGRIAAERSNNRIFYFPPGRYDHSEQAHGWIKFTLTKK